MNITRSFVSLATQTLHPQRWLAAAKRKAIRVEVLALGLLLMPVILVMADHLPFVDVPSSAFYHDAVGAIFGARITTGTTPTTFSPEDPVLRGQMAAFLHRGLGRIAYDDTGLPYVNLGTDYVDLAEITLNTGGVPGGTGFVKLDGVVYSSTNSTIGCPCNLAFYISAGNSVSPFGWAMLYNAYNNSGGSTSTNGAITWAISVPTGTTQIFRLRARYTGSYGPLPTNSTRGSLTAIYAPFGKLGTNTLSSSEEVSEEATPNSQ